MTLWHIEPRDPFVVRDGRPNQGRSEPDTLRFPFPSTTSGLVRTRLGSDAQGRFELQDHISELLAVEIRGPMLAEGSQLFFPAPKDALILSSPEGERLLKQLRPIVTPSDALIGDLAELDPVGLETDDVVAGKPPRDLPAFWPWQILRQWLVAPEALAVEKILAQGLERLPVEDRIHVALGETETALEGMLFASSGLRFASEKRQLSLVVDVGDCALSDGSAREIRPGLAPGGGERRLCRWFRASTVGMKTSLDEAIAFPGDIADLVKADAPVARVRLVLVTPAVFTEGWRPTWLLAERAGVRPKLRAACVPRPETISGWDFAKRQPKASRRLASAGSVYWLDLEGEPEARLQWAQEVWMHSISDEPQDRRDGFGLAALGVAS